MSARLKMLRRIEAVYGLVEAAHSVTLRQAMATMREAEEAIAGQMVLLQTARGDGRTALGGGDREAWALAELARAQAGAMRDRLEVLRLERETAARMAREQHTASRVQREQIKRLVESGECVEQVAAGRQAQAMSDERFLARMHWNRLRLETV